MNRPLPTTLEIVDELIKATSTRIVEEQLKLRYLEADLADLIKKRADVVAKLPERS